MGKAKAVWTEPPKQYRGRRSAGYTVIEVMIVALIIATVSVWAAPAYVQMLQRQKIDRAILQIRLLEGQINRFFDEEGDFPDSLGELVPPAPVDPWGRAYEYLTPANPGWRGRFRKDRFLVPLNSDYDLYSLGPDGESQPPLRPKVSWDDIIRANNGGYVGIAADF